MAYFSLPTGKVVNLPIEDILDLTDEKIQELIAMDAGTEINDPFADMSSTYKKENYKVPEVDDIIEPLDEKIIEDIKKQINNEPDEGFYSCSEGGDSS